MLAHSLSTVSQIICLGAAAFFTVTFLHIATIGLLYPFPLEWMEGHTIDIMQRILDGKAFYTKPSLEYVPYLYTPYYFYVSAFVALFTGVDFMAARLVSLLSVAGIAALMVSWVRKEEGSWIAGLISVGLFLATYKISGRWLDVARVDSLYLLLMFAGLYVFYFYKSRHSEWLVAALFCFAFFTKQSAILALLPAFFAALLLDKGRAWRCALIAGLLILAGCTYLQIRSDGWFSFYIYDVGAGHSNDMRQVKLFWTRDLLPHVPIMMAASLILCIALLSKQNWRKCLWYTALLLGFTGSAYISRIHSFGHINVVIPTYFILSLMLGVLLAKSYKRPPLGVLLSAAIAGQFYMLHYEHTKLMPTPAAEERGNKFIEEIAKLEGDVLFAELQFIQTKAGKKPYSIGMAGFDVLRSDLGDKNHIKHTYKQSISRAMKEKRFGAVVMGHFIRVNALHGNYTHVKTVNQPQEFVTGAVYFDRARIFLPVND